MARDLVVGVLAAGLATGALGAAGLGVQHLRATRALLELDHVLVQRQLKRDLSRVKGATKARRSVSPEKTEGPMCPDIERLAELELMAAAELGLWGLDRPASPTPVASESEPLARLGRFLKERLGSAEEGAGSGSLGPSTLAANGGGSVGTFHGAEAYGFGSGRGRVQPARVSGGSLTVVGSLPPEVVRRIVRANYGRFRVCYESGLKQNPALAGRVRVGFTISQSGSVTAASSTGKLPNPHVKACIARSFHHLTFPSPASGTVTVSYPVDFTPPSP